MLLFFITKTLILYSNNCFIELNESIDIFNNYIALILEHLLYLNEYFTILRACQFLFSFCSSVDAAAFLVFSRYATVIAKLP